MTKEIIYGQIYDVQADHVIITCRLSSLDEPCYLKKRRFVRELLAGAVNLQEGRFVRITITIEPGKQVTEITEEENDMSSYFVKEDHFKGLENTPFMKASTK